MRPQSRGRALILEDPTRGIGHPAGFETRSVASASDALELAHHETFDVVIVDTELALFDGASFIRRLHAQGPTPWIIFVSSQPSNELAATAAELGVRSHLLHRPVAAKVLERVASAAVESNHRVSELLRAVVRPSKTPRSMSATTAKNEFGSVLETAVQDGAVIITKHDSPKAVLVSVDRVDELLTRNEPSLQALTAEFDELVARMRTTEGRAAARGIFTAPPSAFRDAAVAGAKKRG